MNKKTKDIIVIIGLIIGTFGFLTSFGGNTGSQTISLNVILYSLCLIIVGTSRET